MIMFIAVDFIIAMILSVLVGFALPRDVAHPTSSQARIASTSDVLHFGGLLFTVNLLPRPDVKVELPAKIDL